MCREDNLCASPLQDGRRCNKDRVGESFHCAHHASLARSSHYNYKKHKRIAELIINPSSIDEYKKLYYHTTEEYLLRTEHMNRFFVESKRDTKGHGKRIEVLRINSEYYLKKLEELYSKQPDEEISLTSSSFDEEKPRSINNPVPRKNISDMRFREMKERYERIDKQWRDLEDAWIKTRENMDKLFNLMYKTLISFLVEHDLDEGYYSQLLNIMYFLYIPDKCSNVKPHEHIQPIINSCCIHGIILAEGMLTLPSYKKFYIFCISNKKHVDKACEMIKIYENNTIDSICIISLDGCKGEKYIGNISFNYYKEYIKNVELFRKSKKPRVHISRIISNLPLQTIDFNSMRY